MTNLKPVKNTPHLIQGTRTFKQTLEIVRDVERELRLKEEEIPEEFIKKYPKLLRKLAQE